MPDIIRLEEPKNLENVFEVRVPAFTKAILKDRKGHHWYRNPDGHFLRLDPKEVLTVYAEMIDTELSISGTSTMTSSNLVDTLKDIAAQVAGKNGMRNSKASFGSPWLSFRGGCQ